MPREVTGKIQLTPPFFRGILIRGIINKMSVKLALLKSGETVITDIQQLIDENDKLVSYVFQNPYVVRLLTPTVLFEGDETVETEHKVSFYPWIVLSNDKQIVVDRDWIVSIVEPNDFVKDSYVDKMNKTTEATEELSDESLPKETLIENFEVIQEEKNG